jgi:hypothetical protein
MAERKLNVQSIKDVRSLWHKREELEREAKITEAGRLADRINEANLRGIFSDRNEGIRLMKEELDGLLRGKDSKFFCDALVFYCGATELKEMGKRMWGGGLPLVSSWEIIVNKN